MTEAETWEERTVGLTVRGEYIGLLFTPAQMASQEFTRALHQGCCGWVDRIQVSVPWWVLRCRECGLRILLPDTVKTVDDLKRWAEKHIS